jgi:hypothetical protein
VRLDNNKVKSHVCPCKLSKLESIVTRL